MFFCTHNVSGTSETCKNNTILTFNIIIYTVAKSRMALETKLLKQAQREQALVAAREEKRLRGLHAFLKFFSLCLVSVFFILIILLLSCFYVIYSYDTHKKDMF